MQEQVNEIKAEIRALQDKNSILTNEIKFEQKKRTANIPRLIKEKENFILKGERRSEELHSSSLLSIELYTEEFREKMGDEEKEHLRGLGFGGNVRGREMEGTREEELLYKKEEKRERNVGYEEGDEEVELLQAERRENEDAEVQEEEGIKGKGDGEGGKVEELGKKEGRKKKKKKKKSGIGIFSFLINKEYVLTGLLLLIPLYFLTNPKHY